MFAVGNRFDINVLLHVLIGTSLVIGGACVLNNIYDRSIDEQMARTKQRALVTKTISVAHASLFASLLLVSGIAVLIIAKLYSVCAIGLSAVFFYVVLYGYAKRRTWYATHIGAVPGAASILAGYVAAAGFGFAGWLLFLIMCLWQMPHFFAIAIFRRQEYAAANIPIVSVSRGNTFCRNQITIYTILLLPATLSVWIFGFAGWQYALVMSVLCLLWIWYGLQRVNTKQLDGWARRMFGCSLVILLGFCTTLSLFSNR